jgi:hypothetical protein
MIRKVPPLKVENNYPKNNSPRFRITKLVSPLSTNRTTLSISPP